MADRKISDLTALTTPASGDFLPIVDISEVAAASKNKRITIEELFRGVPLGTAAAPSIAIEGDENTGIYSPGADQLAISTNGTGRLFVDASGNVGINKTPGFSLDVKGGYQTTAARFLRSADYGEVIRIGRDSVSETVSFNYPANGVLAIHTAGSERLRITDTGLLGLGTSSPGATLHVSAASATTARLASTDNCPTTFGQSSAGLELVGGAANTSAKYFPAIKFGSTDSDLTTTSPKFGAAITAEASEAYTSDTAGGATLAFWTAPNNPGVGGNLQQRLTITSAGLVGIGTTAPQGIFQIGTDFGGKRGGATTDIVIADTTSGATRFFEFQSASNATRSILFSDATTGNYGAIGYDHSADALFFQTAANNAARIDSSGRLLIGTSSDSGGALLQVNGNRIRIATANTPASAGATGATGEIAWDADYIYVCTATNTWKRTAIATW
jgi:hypothetical protein